MNSYNKSRRIESTTCEGTIFLTKELRAEATKLKFAGKLVAAVKLIYYKTGCSLVEARQAYDALRAK